MDNRTFGPGEGKNKKEAEQAAAGLAYEALVEPQAAGRGPSEPQARRRHRRSLAQALLVEPAGDRQQGFPGIEPRILQHALQQAAPAAPRPAARAEGPGPP